ncbi:MAG TPA: alpha/beta fold hydrolase [Kofleriaceae bacterium]|nr:alpha/beta fold hydrolase [Kofleriaceae bacterium]
MTATTLGGRSLATPFAARVFYATNATPMTHTFGPYTFDFAVDAPVLASDLPLVVVSHGMTGTPWGYRGLASHLAHAGFAVLLLEHPGDSRRDPTKAGTAEILATRPRDIRAALDAAFADPHVAPHLRAGSAAIIGHSMGGYTALAVAGGKPLALPNQTPDGIAHPVDVERDPRITRAVLLAPAIPWLMAPGALAEVTIPLLVRVGEKDTDTPPFFVERILASLPASTPLDFATVPRAGHFAFFYPVPPALALLPPGQDPPGFDRAAYQSQLYAELAAFLR